MAKGQLCYQCFERFKPHEVWFRCDNPARQENKTEACPYVLDPKLKEWKHRPFPLHGLSAAWTSQFRKPKRCQCDYCGVVSRTRICPHCHWKLPVEHGDLAEHIIAVVGNSRSGKSHYFTVLIEKELSAASAIGSAFGGSTAPGDFDTETLFYTDYYKPLFHDRIVIEPTRADRTHRRLIFSVVLNKLNCRLTFVFYDIAGERLAAAGDEVEEVTNATRYLWNASGIIYLVNPKDVEEWEPFLTERVGTRAEPAGRMFNRIALEFKKNKEISKRRIDVPLAICISQFDRLRDRRNHAGLSDDLFEPSATPIQGGRIDHAKLQSESQILRNFMLNSRGTSAKLVSESEDRFRNVCFFAASALGHSPDERGAIGEIKPCRVGVPFFWILSRLGIGKAARG